MLVNAEGERVSRLKEVDSDWILRRLERWGRRVRPCAPNMRIDGPKSPARNPAAPCRRGWRQVIWLQMHARVCIAGHVARASSSLTPGYLGPVQDGLPFVGPAKGAVLAGLVAERKPGLAVEVGTLAGYSALVIAQALGPAARLISLEADWKWALVAKRFVWQAAQGEKRSKAVCGLPHELLSFEVQGVERPKPKSLHPEVMARSATRRSAAC